MVYMEMYETSRIQSTPLPFQLCALRFKDGDRKHCKIVKLTIN